MAATEWAARAAVVLGDQVVYGVGVDFFEAELTGQAGDHYAETLLRGVRRLDLVGNPAEEGFIDELARFEVCRENDELIERHADLFAVGEAQEVVSFLERHDPAVQELDRLHALAAEVVDQECSEIALQLQRGFADFGNRVEVDFEVVHPELAAGDDGRALI